MMLTLEKQRQISELGEILQRSDLLLHETAKLYSSPLQWYLTFVHHSKMKKEGLTLFMPETQEAPVPPV